MQINPTFAFVGGATQTDIVQFESAVNDVIAVFDTVFTNVDVKLDIVFAYGEKYLSDNGSTITYQPMANASPGSVTLGVSTPALDDSKSYVMLLSHLETKFDSWQSSAYGTLPTVQSNPFRNDNLILSLAQEKALGFTPGVSIAGKYDGVVGIISNEELHAGGFSADWTPESTPSSNNQYYMIGNIEHELTEVMGRFAFDGTNFNNAPSYTLMDLFRYSAPGVRQTTNGNPAYFSIDKGNHVYYYWNTNPAGDLGDWAPSGPNGFQPTGNDPFLNVEKAGFVNDFSSTADLVLMNVLGWDFSDGHDFTLATLMNYVDRVDRGLSLGNDFTLADTIPAVAVEASMYGVTGTSAEITKLETQFLPAQVSNAHSHGFDPVVYASEALGLAFAFGNETGSTAFATNFGPAKAGMPNTTAGDTAFAGAASTAIFGAASTSNLVNVLDHYVTNWKAFYTSNGIPGIVHATAAQIDLAARGAAWGDAVGVALDNNLGPLKGQATNFLAAAQGTAASSASLASQPTHAAFYAEGGAASGAADATNVQLTGVAAHVDHIAMF